MSASEWVYALHWVIYIASFIAFILLFTKYRKWGAVWIAGLFLSQAIFHGCVVVDWQNYYRVQEGLAPLTNEMLTDRFSDIIWIQAALSYAVATAATVIVFL